MSDWNDLFITGTAKKPKVITPSIVLTIPEVEKPVVEETITSPIKPKKDKPRKPRVSKPKVTDEKFKNELLGAIKKQFDSIKTELDEARQERDKALDFIGKIEYSEKNLLSWIHFEVNRENTWRKGTKKQGVKTNEIYRKFSDFVTMDEIKYDLMELHDNKILIKNKNGWYNLTTKGKEYYQEIKE